MTWRAGEWRELADGRVVRLARPIGDGLWVVSGGYDREQESRLLTEEEVREWTTLMLASERGEILLSESDLADPVTS